MWITVFFTKKPPFLLWKIQGRDGGKETGVIHACHILIQPFLYIIVILPNAAVIL